MFSPKEIPGVKSTSTQICLPEVHSLIENMHRQLKKNELHRRAEVERRRQQKKLSYRGYMREKRGVDRWVESTSAKLKGVQGRILQGWKEAERVVREISHDGALEEVGKGDGGGSFWDSQ